MSKNLEAAVAADAIGEIRNDSHGGCWYVQWLVNVDALAKPVKLYAGSGPAVAAEPVGNDLHARALEIADAAMLADVRCIGTEIGPNCFALYDEELSECSKLVDASEALTEAFNWLQQRGLARLAVDQHGSEFIVLVEPAAASSAPAAPNSAGVQS